MAAGSVLVPEERVPVAADCLAVALAASSATPLPRVDPQAVRARLAGLGVPL